MVETCCCPLRDGEKERKEGETIIITDNRRRYRWPWVRMVGIYYNGPKEDAVVCSSEGR